MIPSLILYYRQDCHLCEQMLAEIHALYDGNLDVRMVDVDSEPSLQAKYRLKVPVLVAGGQELCYGRLDRASLENFLESF